MVDKKTKDFVKRKILFENEINDSKQVLKGCDDESTKHFRLKRLFKYRGKVLQQRAESLTNNQYIGMLGYNCNEIEEEKETKRIDPLISNLKKIQSPTGSVENFDISIDLKKQDLIGKDLVKNTSKTSFKQKTDSGEDKKGDVSDEEFKKFKPNQNKLCGIKRTKSFNTKDEFERSLKDFTCTICMDYMVGTKKLT